VSEIDVKSPSPAVRPRAPTPASA